MRSDDSGAATRFSRLKPQCVKFFSEIANVIDSRLKSVAGDPINLLWG